MLFDDQYHTIQSPSEGIFRDKGSKFIAYAYPLKSEDELKPILTSLRAEHGKARHFCWALRLTPDRGIFRINDDGEPSGTAGRPILNALLSADLTNVLVVVVRYFGGTLLGVPGLINAYKTATQEAITNATVVDKTVNDVYEVVFEYLHMNEVMRVLKEESLPFTNQAFDTNCSLQIEIRKSALNRVVGKIEGIEGVKAHYITTR